MQQSVQVIEIEFRKREYIVHYVIDGYYYPATQETPAEYPVVEIHSILDAEGERYEETDSRLGEEFIEKLDEEVFGRY